jgi:ADP-heptose:LPS heptosyltransferase
VVHIGAGTQAKRWPAEHWKWLIDRLTGSRRAMVVLVGGAGDWPLARAIRPSDEHAARTRVVDLVGELSIAELVAVVEQADLFIGADSGPAHIAAAVGTPAVVLFSGTNRPRQWRPSGREVHVLRHFAECSPCHRHECPLPGHPCMRGLSPEQVLELVERFLAEPALLETTPAIYRDQP